MIEKLVVGDFIKENTYFYIDDKTKHGFLIDPGGNEEKILDTINKNSWIIEKILITHGHFDHIGAVNFLKIFIKCEVYAGIYSDLYLENPEYNLGFMNDEQIIVKNVKKISNNEKICLESNKNFYLKLIETPGHTKDSVCYINEEEKIAFVGDTIFEGTHGRTDLPGSEPQLMMDSIKKILSLDKDTILYPGHSNITIVANEIANYK